MPLEPVVSVIGLAVAVNLVLMAAAMAPSLRRRREAGEGTSAREPGEERDAAIRRAAAAGVVTDEFLDDGVSLRTYDRVVRVVAWSFILGSGAIVAVTGLWPDTQPAILLLLGFAAGFILVVHDVLPARVLGGAKFLVEGSVAITFAGLLVLLTGQGTSPFFFVFPLIVAGAALVVEPRVTLVLAGVASFAYLVAIVAPLSDRPLEPSGLVAAAINLSALVLLAYVAMVIAREQRRSRLAAIVASTVDPLTSLFNRAFFFAALEREIVRSSRSGRGFCLVMADLDGLKEVNDRHGHFHGDRVLRAVGSVIRDGVRRIDTAARYGGDEFVVLLPETDPTGAWVLAEKVRQGVANLAFDGPLAGYRTSLSLGVVAYPYDGRTADELIITADDAMYASKREGRNRVSRASSREAPPPEDEVTGPATAVASRSDGNSV